VCLSIGLSVTRLRPAKTANGIEVLFGLETFASQTNMVLDGGPDRPHPKGRGGVKRQPLYYIITRLIRLVRQTAPRQMRLSKLL